MARTTKSSTVQTSVAKNTRTTRQGLINVVRGNSIVLHAEFDVKADKSQRALTQRLYEIHVKWGNLSAPPTVSRDPQSIKLDDVTTAYIAVITHPDNQCSMCGSWEKADYCKLCQGELIDEDSVAADI